MQKIGIVILLAITCSLMGCTAKNRAVVTSQREYVVEEKQANSKVKKCCKGKFGAEKIEQDIIK